MFRWRKVTVNFTLSLIKCKRIIMYEKTKHFIFFINSVGVLYLLSSFTEASFGANLIINS